MQILRKRAYKVNKQMISRTLYLKTYSARVPLLLFLLFWFPLKGKKHSENEENQEFTERSLWHKAQERLSNVEKLVCADCMSPQTLFLSRFADNFWKAVSNTSLSPYPHHQPFPPQGPHWGEIWVHSPVCLYPEDTVLCGLYLFLYLSFLLM